MMILLRVSIRGNAVWREVIAFVRALVQGDYSVHCVAVTHCNNGHKAAYATEKPLGH